MRHIYIRCVTEAEFVKACTNNRFVLGGFYLEFFF